MDFAFHKCIMLCFYHYSVIKNSLLKNTHCYTYSSLFSPAIHWSFYIPYGFGIYGIAYSWSFKYNLYRLAPCSFCSTSSPAFSVTNILDFSYSNKFYLLGFSFAILSYDLSYDAEILSYDYLRFMYHLWWVIRILDPFLNSVVHSLLLGFRVFFLFWN